jgi:hypothetical protein
MIEMTTSSSMSENADRRALARAHPRAHGKKTHSGLQRRNMYVGSTTDEAPSVVSLSASLTFCETIARPCSRFLVGRTIPRAQNEGRRSAIASTAHVSRNRNIPNQNATGGIVIGIGRTGFTGVSTIGGVTGRVTGGGVVIGGPAGGVTAANSCRSSNGSIIMVEPSTVRNCDPQKLPTCVLKTLARGSAMRQSNPTAPRKTTSPSMIRL